MVQAKKSSVKKKPIVKAAAARKPVARKAPVKRATAVRTRTVKSKAPAYQHFKVAPAPKFFSFAVTEQTAYWVVLGLIVLAFGAWVLTVNDSLQRMYDQIDAKQMSVVSTKA